VCKEWRIQKNYKGFWNFVAWTNQWLKDNKIKSIEGLEIDREDTNGNYEPNNCRWVTHKVNSNNRRITVLVVYKGLEMTLTAAIEKFGVKGLSYTTAYQRLLRNYPIEDILTLPIGRWKNNSKKKNLKKLLTKTLKA
jgi:hypothetical protein